jgi:hypothetical protein
MSPEMAHRVISVRCGIWSLSGQSGHGRACCWLDPVAIDPQETSSSSAVQRVRRVDGTDAPANIFSREGHERVLARVRSQRSELPSGCPLLYLPPGLCRCCRRHLGQPE